MFKIASSESAQPTSNWVYNTCNGYRNLSPNEIDFSCDNNGDLISVAFNHIVTLWSYDSDGISFKNDLIHCDTNDLIKEIRFINANHLLVVHNNCLNVWFINRNSNDLLTNEEQAASCVWSSQIDNVLAVSENPYVKSQFVLCIKSNVLLRNEDTPAEIKGKSLFLIEMLILFNANMKKKIYFLITHKFEKINFLGFEKFFDLK